MERKVGIWLDKREAFIMILEGNSHRTISLPSNIRTFHPKGGSRGKNPYGPVLTVKEKSYLARENQQHADFFKQILELLKQEDHVIIIGPAQMKNELGKYLNEFNNLNFEILDIKPADSLTKN